MSDSTPSTERQSNFELMRIVVMLAIIAHHYVVNSGVRACFSMADHPARTVFLQWWGMFGKAGINAFVLLSGYFLCTSRLTPLRYLKVLTPVILYRTLTYCALVLLGYSTFSWTDFANLYVQLLSKAGSNGSFSSSIIVFYLTVPALCAIVGKLDRQSLLTLVGTSVALTVGLNTIFCNLFVFNEVLWFCILFFLAAWIRLYAGEWSLDLTLCAKGLLASVAVSAACVVFIDLVAPKYAYYLVDYPSKICAFAMGLFAFLVFRNLKVRQSIVVNRIASHVFGILLFHANSLARRLLWKSGSLFDVPAAFMQPLPMLVLHALGVTVAVFCMGLVFDALVVSKIEDLVYRTYQRHCQRP